MTSECKSPVNRSRRRKWIFIVAGLVFLGLIVLPVGLGVFQMWGSLREIKQKQKVLLFQSDNAALNDACREVWQHRSNFGKDEGGFVDIDPSNRNLPGQIMKLDAHSMDAWASGLNIELGGQGCHYGFEAFFSDPKTDTKRTVWKDVYPSTEVAPGLWFYAENGLPQKSR
jgi:hypothetical protein